VSAYRHLAQDLLMGEQGGKKEDVLGSMRGNDKTKMHGRTGLHRYQIVQLGLACSTDMVYITRSHNFSVLEFSRPFISRTQIFSTGPKIRPVQTTS
jgi:hypothetical protein